MDHARKPRSALRRPRSHRLHAPQRPTGHGGGAPYVGRLEGRPLIPPVREFHQKGMHRLIPSRYSETGTVLQEVAGNEAMLADAARLDAATNERIQGELHGLSGVSHFELVYGIPNAHIIRAAFLHPGPFGSRFNDTTRGAWYAAKKVETSIAEVAYHKSKRVSEMVVPGLPQD